MSLLIISLIFIFRNLLSKQNEYAITANQSEITFIKLGTFKWEEINKITSIDENSLFSRNPQYYIVVVLKNGKKLTINVTSFDYQAEELSTILKTLGKLNA
ncbi:hypothetical protein [Pedobacter psychrotolerans]|nr:hypothetical protein [Pedobacter psychrotolerans]GGE66894.1 hypothetical protein GCM10011413_36840 [Pedobacter psychrotolerans]